MGLIACHLNKTSETYLVKTIPFFLDLDYATHLVSANGASGLDGEVVCDPDVLLAAHRSEPLS